MFADNYVPLTKLVEEHCEHYVATIRQWEQLGEVGFEVTQFSAVGGVHISFSICATPTSTKVLSQLACREIAFGPS